MLRATPRARSQLLLFFCDSPRTANLVRSCIHVSLAAVFFVCSHARMHAWMYACSIKQSSNQAIKQSSDQAGRQSSRQTGRQAGEPNEGSRRKVSSNSAGAGPPGAEASLTSSQGVKKYLQFTSLSLWSLRVWGVLSGPQAFFFYYYYI
jgi:hypothetical protein